MIMMDVVWREGDGRWCWGESTDGLVITATNKSFYIQQRRQPSGEYNCV
jgi:hypothetical protein